MAVQLPLQFEYNSAKTFTDYFSGCNQEVVDHLQACIYGTGETQVFIWGDAGLGKTHLLQACCTLSRERNKSPFYLHLTAQELPNISILEGLEHFSLVCIDNIHHIANNTEWEHAFFVFFNQLREHQHGLILSAPLPPGELPIQLPDLKTRLAWGLTLKLKALPEKQRINALSFKAHQYGFDLSPQIGRFLLQNYARDLPSLWLLLEKINHETLAAKRKLTIPFLKQILKND